MIFALPVCAKNIDIKYTAATGNPLETVQYPKEQSVFLITGFSKYKIYHTTGKPL